METMEHVLDASLLDKRVQIYLIGVGGNGAQMATCLARLDIAIKALGHPYGLHITAFDGDRVSEANVGRQLYSPADVGRYKAVVTIHRLNQFYGLDWIAHPCRFEDFEHGALRRPDADLIVSCVDTRSARQALHARLFEGSGQRRYWLDLGNTEATAQVVLGEAPGRRSHSSTGQSPRLPCVTELFPELLDRSVADTNTPSCSVRMSLASQGLFINDVAVRYAAQILYELFSNGRIRQHGVLINLESKRSGPIDIDPVAWSRFGYCAAGADTDAVAA
ncbi:PRTRC system ThiF family protein [Massilia sp. CMS3.1]|uniref:PRTRC system ThiF family protein n=1 Tax=Massilia sp. CMS3.1 TaxID=3373083 RepID=UPI003EE6EDB5